MFSDPLFKGHYSRLVDGTEVTEFAVSAETVRALATAAVERGLRKAALISNDTDLVYALMRMYEAYSKPPSRSRRVPQHAGRSAVAGQVNRVLILGSNRSVDRKSHGNPNHGIRH